MSIDNSVHKLVLHVDTSNNAHTACGIDISAIYPAAWYATPMEAGSSNIRVTISNDKKIVTCEECRKKVKEV